MENENNDWYKNVNLKSGEEMNTDWWSPEPGKYEVKFLAEAGKQYEVTFERNGKPEVNKKIPFEIEIDGKKMTWGVTIGVSETSAYGQMVNLALKHKGVIGLNTEILVTGVKKERRYTIPEVVGFNHKETTSPKITNVEV